MNAKRCLSVASVLFVMLFVVRSNAQELPPADKEKAVKYLETPRKNIEEATRGLSDAQWNFKSAPDRWSVAECVEHIAPTEDRLQGKVTAQEKKAPGDPVRDVARAV